MVIKVTTATYLITLLFNLVFGMVSYFIWRNKVRKIESDFKEVNISACKNIHVLFLTISFVPGLNVPLMFILIMSFLFLAISLLFNVLKI